MSKTVKKGAWSDVQSNDVLTLIKTVIKIIRDLKK